GIHVPAGGGEVLAGSLITRDFDGDGNMDLAWVGLDSVQGGAPPRYLQAFGLGNGTFQLMSIINIQGGLISGATGQQEGASGDFNGDGHPDLAYRVTDGHQGSITRVDVLLYDPVAKRFNRLPDSTGLLGPIPRNTNFYRDNAIGFADLDGDGKGELFVHSTAIPAQGNASAIPERFTVYESSGAPATDAAQLFTRNVVENPGLSANSPVVSYADWDFNRDGHRDLVAQLDNGLAVVALGNGDFTFRAPTTYFTNGNGRIFVDDVTGDGLPDLVAHWAGFIPHSIRSLLSILPGRPDGTFGAAQQLAVANNNNALGLAVGDFNLDGKTDLFTSSKAQTAEAFLAAPPGLADVATGDLDGDGRLDLVAVNTGFDRVKLQLGQGSSAFARQDDLFVGASPVALQLADLDGDHRLDIVTANRVGQSITWLKNAGNGSFTRTDLALPARPERVAVADLNGDDKPDLVTISTIGRSLTVLPSGPGGFGAAMTLDLGFAAGDVALADLTGDGELDAVLSDPAGKRLLVLPGLGDGSFGAARTIALPDGPGRLAVSDLNADHKLDVVMTFSDSDKVGILFGRGDARFSTVQTISVGHTPSALHVADVNGDNRPDLLVTNAGDSTLSVILNRFDPANLYRYLPTATDPDSDPVSFDLAQAPGGMLFDDATGEILWAPMPDQVGPNAVVVQASDGRGGEATQGYTILVTAPLTTPSPVFISTPTTAIAADGTYAYQPSTTNPAGNPLRYALVNGPEGMTVDPTTGAVTWDPRENGISLALFRQDYNGVYGRGRIETPDSPSLRSASVTAEGWYKFDSNLSRAMLLRKKFFDGNFGLTNISTWGLENRGGIPRAFIGDADAPQAVIAAPAGFELGVWYHVALTFDDATRTLSFYLNGALAGTAVAPGPLNYSNEPLQIGA
ncbi:MAG: FG-GAP-like repeat-containing protein, partial [Planctomycetales bacterium]